MGKLTQGGKKKKKDFAGEDAPKAKQQTPRDHPQVPFQSTRLEQNTYTLPGMPQVPTSHMVVLKSLLE